MIPFLFVFLQSGLKIRSPWNNPKMPIVRPVLSSKHQPRNRVELHLHLEGSQNEASLTANYQSTCFIYTRIFLHYNLSLTKFIFCKFYLGAIRVSTIVEIAAKKGAHVHGCSSYSDVLDFVTMSTQSSLFDLISRINAYMHLFKYDLFDWLPWWPHTASWFLSSFLFARTLSGDLEAIERIAYELCEDQARENVCYFEVRYAPQYLSNTSKYLDQIPLPEDHPDAVTPDMVVQAINRGLKRGQEQFDIKARSILCCIRNFPGRPKNI